MKNLVHLSMVSANFDIVASLFNTYLFKNQTVRVILLQVFNMIYHFAKQFEMSIQSYMSDNEIMTLH